MGNREDLLAGARKAVLERGLAKVTARDIAGAAGVSLAAIGYHFGSKDRLIAEAITEGIGSEIGDGMDAIIRDTGEGHSLWESVEWTWDAMLNLAFERREELMLSMENGVRIAHSPESQGYLSAATEGAYSELTTLLQTVHPNLSAEEAHAVAKVYFMLFQGVAILSLMGPSSDPLRGEDVKLAIKALYTK